MLKFIQPTWDFGIEPVSLVKLASGGIGPADRKQLERRMDAKFVKYAHDHLKPATGEEYVHTIAVGANEYYGPNRKGDSFREDVCVKYHPTFAKIAKWYRDHKSDGPHYGIVKAAWYDKNRRRIDLIVALNATKTAADRNGGRVADRELDFLYSGQSLPVSMACLVSYDVCSGCGNKARTEWEHCDARKCVKYGGCQENLGKTFADGHTLCVDNPDPLFFDISYVRFPADRTAYTLGLLKNPNIPLSKLASEGLQDIFYKTEADIPASVVRDRTRGLASPWQIEIIWKQAALERHLTGADDETGAVWRREYRAPRCSLKQATAGGLLAATAQRDCVVPPDVFFQYVYPRMRGTAPVMQPVDVGNCFRDLLKTADMERKIFTNPYRFSSPITCIDTQIAEVHNESWSVRPELARRNMVRAAVLEQPRHIKTASGLTAPALAAEYALYQLAFLERQTYDTSLGTVLTLANKTW